MSPARVIPFALAAAAALEACAPHAVRHERETTATGLPRPTMVYVADFAVDASEVQLDPGGPLSRLRSALLETDDQDEQAIVLGHALAARVAEQLAAEITAMGLPAQRAVRGAPLPDGAAVVRGQFAEVDEGNRIRRLAIGFYQGQSSISAHVELYGISRHGEMPLLTFVASTASAPLPGAAVTMGAGAAVGAGLAVSGAATGARAVGGRGSIESDADELAKTIARSLQAFFAQQGWTAPPPELGAWGSGLGVLD